MEKVCCKCKILKQDDMFHKDSSKKDGLETRCKYCRKEQQDQYRTNPEFSIRMQNYNHKYRKENIEDCKVREKKYYKIRMSTHGSVERIRRSLRSRLRKALRGTAKSKSIIKLLGCSIEELKQHLSKQFKPGMTWENYGQWHIDHILPCSKFDLTQPNQQEKCCHYSNLQPLWALENIQKSNKII